MIKSINFKKHKKYLVIITLFIIQWHCLAQSPIISYDSLQNYALGTPITPLVPINTGGAVPSTIYGQVTTFAGSGAVGFANGLGIAATFEHPFGVTIDIYDNIYVADYYNNQIRKISSGGLVSTLAGIFLSGSGDGIGTSARFNEPTAVTVDALGNVYVADTYNHKIRKITSGGVVSTLAGSGVPGFSDGIGIAASFNHPYGITVDNSGNVFVADLYNNKIRKITAEGVVSTFAGSGVEGSVNGIGTAASFRAPYGLAIDAFGNIYVGDAFNNRIRKITSGGVVSTLAGDGSPSFADGIGIASRFNYPTGVAVDGIGNIYVADELNNKIRVISSEGVVSTLAGSGIPTFADGIGLAASFNNPNGVAVDNSGNVFVADTYNNKIRKICTTGYSINPLLPAGLVFDAKTGIINGTPTTTSTATIYTITGHNKSGSSSAKVRIETSVLGSKTFSNQQIKLFPNPTHNELSLQFPQNTNLDSIIITDILGKVVYKKKLSNQVQTNETSIYPINVENLAKGLYLIQVFSGIDKYQEKFLKE